VQAAYRLVQAPSAATQVSAKTAWNLRVRQPVAFSGSTGGVVPLSFVTDGAPGAFSAGSDLYLRGGDISAALNSGNKVDLQDYRVLQANYGTIAGGAADINGDGKVNILDYSLLQVNFNQSGDADVQ